jgi:NitT/TauT family transport system ATP-binding protein
MTGGGRTAALELQGIVKRFRGDERLLFDQFALSVPAGQSLAIVGPSGAGKSTLLNLISLLDAPNAGQVIHQGRPMTPREVGSLPMGYIFQRDALLPWATVSRNIQVAAECRRVDGRAALSRARAFFSRIGLSGIEARFPQALSGGQRQLVALAQSFVLEPELLLLDEPFAHLDFQTKLALEAELLNIVRASHRGDSKPMTLIMVTHDIDEAVVIADRIVAVAGYPFRPTHIVRDISVDIALSDRDPVKVRESSVRSDYFQQAWDAIRTSAVGFKVAVE